MKSIHGMLFFAICIALVVSGCDLITNNNGSASRATGNDLVINEVFTISPDKYYAFSWLEIYNPSSHSIRWTDSTTPAAGFVVGDNGTILSTVDNGGRWDPMNTGTNVGLRAIRFREPDSGYAVGENGTILRSTDHGKTWAPQVSGTSATLNAVAITNPEIGSKYAWIAGDSGVILYTANVGVNWNPAIMGSGTTHNLHWLDMYSEAGEVGAMYAAGDAGTVLKSTDAGTSWQPTNVNPNYSYYGVVSYKDTSWAVGTNGSAFISKDAGKDYTIESTYVTGTLRSIFVSRPAYGNEFGYGLAWAVGDGGSIVRTTNYGANWLPVTSPTLYNLNAVQFIDSHNGWAVGDHGTIIATSDGGLTWSTQPSNTTANLYGAYFYPKASLPTISQKYILFLYAQRRHIYFDQTQPIAPGTNPNYDFITKVDTGYVYYDPTQYFGIGRQPKIDPVNPGAFVVINSDSGKFGEHFNLGPGEGTQVENVSLGIYVDSTRSGFEGGIVLWSLLSSSEVRFVKLFQRQRIITIGGFREPIVDSAYVHDIDILRFGNFQYTDARRQQLFYAGLYGFQNYPMAQSYAGNTYPGDLSAGYIPEWWSICRYANDVNVYPGVENSSQSFYLAKDPIPGWYSQRSR